MAILTCYKAPWVLGPLSLITCLLWVSLPSVPPPAMATEYWKWQNLIFPTPCDVEESDMKTTKEFIFRPYFQVCTFCQDMASSNYCHYDIACMTLKAAKVFCVYSLMWFLLSPCCLNCWGVSICLSRYWGLKHLNELTQIIWPQRAEEEFHHILSLLKPTMTSHCCQNEISIAFHDQPCDLTPANLPILNPGHSPTHSLCSPDMGFPSEEGSFSAIFFPQVLHMAWRQVGSLLTEC